MVKLPMFRKLFPPIPVSSPMVHWQWILGVVTAGSVLGLSSTPLAAQTIPLPQAERWLEIQQMTGIVTYHGDRQIRPARIGDRLLQINQGIDTDTQSDSTLLLDSDIGVVRMAENTRLRVNRMAVLPDGGRVTSLAVQRGQARLQVRRFSNPSSNLEIETPAGVAAIRGTTFGVIVDDAGKTGVATLAGAVEVSAQGVSVLVNPGFATSIVPGEPPTPPRRIDRQLRFEVALIQRTSSRVIVRGRTDPANTVQVNGREVTTEADGTFRAVLLNSPRDYFGTESVAIMIRNPIGEIRRHQVAIPDFNSR